MSTIMEFLRDRSSCVTGTSTTRSRRPSSGWTRPTPRRGRPCAAPGAVPGVLAQEGARVPDFREFLSCDRCGALVVDTDAHDQKCR